MLAEITDWLLVLFAPGLIVSWFATIGLLSLLGGWNRLARVYRDEMSYRDELSELSEMTVGHKWGMQSLSLRGWCGYNNCVTVEATERGLKIAPWFIMRPGHAPLFLPFDEMIMARSRTMLGVRLKQVRMQKEPGISLDFRGTLVDNICAKLGDVWPADSTEQVEPETDDA
ncbi:MAG: hypothetical protein QF363_15610 [Planctomycetaceae bacterium]|jgi:hypothetical protein|nr:hypothetical protein [Planctomycetaceae bacterium]